MGNDHPAIALTGTLSSWGLFVSSLVLKALPFLQLVSLVAAIAASIYAIRYYDKRLSEK